MAEYNPFDIAPPIIDKPVEKPAEKPEQAPTQPSADVRYAAPPPARPSDPAAPGRAPLAGQPASMTAAMPQQYASAPSMPYQQMAQSAAPPPMVSEPVPQPGVRYDLAGNPLPPAIPYGAGGPGGGAPDMQGGAQRYDLAGNPLPMSPIAPPPVPQAPPGQYGYAPAPPPPGGGYSSGEYTAPQHSFRSPAAPQSMVPAGMEEAMTAGANWMIGIVILTLATIWINATLAKGFMMPFISYAAITGVVLQPYMLAPFVGGYTTGAVLASIGLIPLALLAVLGFRRQAWVFVIAMIVYGFDIPVTIITWIVHLDLWGIFLATAWHSFVFQRMFAAWTAAREINATLAGQRR